MTNSVGEQNHPLETRQLSDVSHFRPFALMGVAVTGVAGCAALGALTNAVNGLVSPEYFRNILGWVDLSDADVWRASIAQGILEGVMFGLFLSAIYTAVVGLSSGARSTYLFAATHLAGMIGAALACWAVGGLIAIGLATLSPQFYRSAFISVPAGFGDMLRYAWVGGSIWGVEFGGLFCLVIGAVLFRVRWVRNSQRLTSTAVSGDVMHESTGSSYIQTGERVDPSNNIKS